MMSKIHWHYRQIVYQVFIDRFQRSSRYDTLERKGLKKPRVLRSWSHTPKKQERDDHSGYWKHELEFFGGDLQGLMNRLPYLKNLGINTLCLSPIFKAYTCHKYDTMDYFTIDPQYGELEDFECLCQEAHQKGIKVLVDGVFNHIGWRSDWFKQAYHNPQSSYRSFFTFDHNNPDGYLSWFNSKTLPDLNLEHPDVQSILFTHKDSVVKKYLRYADGWRLDAAQNLGMNISAMITRSAHECKQDALVIGELWNYPTYWLNSLDGVMNFYMWRLIFLVVHQKITPRRFLNLVSDMVHAAPFKSLLKSWTIVSNHDTPRMSHLYLDEKLRKLALILQFTLPGSPLVYYGEELGMEGGDDPENRGPMHWDAVGKQNETYQFYQHLISLRLKYDSLCIGEYSSLYSESLIAFIRKTKHVGDLIVCLLNPSKSHVKETIVIPDHRLMSGCLMIELLSQKKIEILASSIDVTLDPYSFWILSPVIHGYNFEPYKRIEHC